jgi:hypothetical protein
VVFEDIRIIQRSALHGLESVARKVGLKRVLKSLRAGQNSRSLHYAAPDFLLRAVALIKFVRLSLRRVAYVVVSNSGEVGNPGTLRSG